MGITGTDGVYHPFYKAIGPLSLNDFREVTSASDVGNIVANGGLLASDTTPILEGNTAETQQINWAASNSDIIAAQTMLDYDFDGRQDVLVEMWVNSGTTDAATFTLETGWDGGALVSTTVTDSAKSATTHRITAVIPASSIPDAASRLTLVLTPAAHTTNAIILEGIRLGYLPRVTS